MAEPVPDPRSGSTDAAGYIADLCAELVRLAQNNRLDMLAYLLGMAQIEADAVRRGRTVGPRGGIAPGRA